jgi:hypothetical protein
LASEDPNNRSYQVSRQHIIIVIGFL